MKYPDHPLVNQTLADCLHEAMDIEGLERLLALLEAGEIRVVACDLTQPSPLAMEVLAARPYAFLDDAPLEERRTQAVMNRRWLNPESAAELGRLDPEAIARVKTEAWPDPINADELHDALAWLGFFSTDELTSRPEWRLWLAQLAQQNRAARLRVSGVDVWIAAERLGQCQPLWPGAALQPVITAPAAYAGQEWTFETGLVDLLRGRLEGLGPMTAATLAAPFGLEPDGIAAALAALEAEGFAMRGRFTPGTNTDEYCARGLLARIHNYTIKRLRAEIEPVAARDFLRFLFVWQHVTADARMEGPDALTTAVMQLEGFEAPASAWETEILPARIGDYEPVWLDDECLAGRVTWARLKPRSPRAGGTGRGVTPVRTTPITLLPRRNALLWQVLASQDDSAQPSSRAEAVVAFIRENGASFFDEITAGTGLLRQQAEEAVAELVALGLLTSDSFGGLRALLAPSGQRHGGGHRRRRAGSYGMEAAGRWALTRRPRPASTQTPSTEAVEHVARSLLLRYGVVFWRVLGTGGGLAAAVARFVACLPTAGGPRRGARWPICRRLLRRTIRFTRRNRSVARNAAEKPAQWLGVALRRRPAQPRRHIDTRTEAGGVGGQPPALP